MATNSFYQGYSLYQNVKARTALLVATTVGRVQRLKLGASSRIASVAILHANPLWNGGKWEVMISELDETSMKARITLRAANPEIAFQLKSHVQEHILDYLNLFKGDSLIGAVADPKPPKEVAEPINSQKLEPAASASREA